MSRPGSRTPPTSRLARAPSGWRSPRVAGDGQPGDVLRRVLRAAVSVGDRKTPPELGCRMTPADRPLPGSAAPDAEAKRGRKSPEHPRAHRFSKQGQPAREHKLVGAPYHLATERRPPLLSSGHPCPSAATVAAHNVAPE